MEDTSENVKCEHKCIILEQSTNKAFYNIPWSAIYPNYNVEKSDYAREFGLRANAIMESIKNGNTGTVQGIAEYKKEAQKRGMQEFIDEQNARIGKSSYQSY
ncbi:MAG: hypothetical protein JXB33_08940 [Clostridia bacterium]|nr:hypothetical protein [Clostridia bacterium]